MAETEIDVDEDALALTAEALGTHTVEDTVNAALVQIAAGVQPSGSVD
ncbi:hypothetical protein ACGFYU_33065 [Streptomyces sp. NPDC048337]